MPIVVTSRMQHALHVDAASALAYQYPLNPPEIFAIDESLPGCAHVLLILWRDDVFQMEVGYVGARIAKRAFPSVVHVFERAIEVDAMHEFCHVVKHLV